MSVRSDNSGGFSDGLNRRFGRLQFSAKRRLNFYKKLLALLRNNVPLSNALDTIQRISSHNGKKPYAPEALAAESLRQRILEGATISEAIRDWVPKRDAMMMQTAEFGTPVKPLEGIIELNESIRRIRSAFIGALSYPAVVLVVIMFMLVGISTSIIPAFIEVAPDVEWVGISKYFIAFTDHIRNWWPVHVIWLVSFIVLIAGTLSVWTGSVRSMFDKFPPWSIYRLWTGSGWILSLSTMLNAGITEMDALTRLDENANRWLSERNNAIRDRVANGQEMGEAMLETGHDFPDFEINLNIAVYAGLSSSGEALQTVAREWVSESQERLEAQSGILRVVVLGLAGLLIATTVTSIFDMEQQLTSQLGGF